MSENPVDLPRYARLEIERRWLVDLAELGELDKSRARFIRDKYLRHSHMRLRSINLGNETVYKLGKKYGHTDALSQPVTSIYLSAEEFAVFDGLEGGIVEKWRYPIAEGSLDIYQRAGKRVGIYELEFDTVAAAQNYAPPAFVREELTGKANYRGVDFART
ncbi:MAG: hypothetical protein KC422_06435 [Trueperaceae bacterium]|nr:hypothetical protein [Trueperaceae bacterium]